MYESGNAYEQLKEEESESRTYTAPEISPVGHCVRDKNANVGRKNYFICLVRLFLRVPAVSYGCCDGRLAARR